MLKRVTPLLLLLLTLALSTSAADADVFRVRVVGGHHSLAADDPQRQQCADFRATVGQPFSHGSRELGWSISGTVSISDGSPRFTGSVSVGTTTASFDDASVVEGVLEPQGMGFSGAIVYFHVLIERI